MFLALMVGFALVMAVVALAGVASIISALADGRRRMDSLATRLEAVAKTANSSMSAQLRSELDDLRGALDVMRASNRKELGGLWARVGGKREGHVFDGTNGRPLVEGDEELQALLALQSAKPVAPGA